MFNDSWELMFFVFENHLKKPQCYICLRQLAKCDKFNIRRHYMSCHNGYEKYKDEERQKLLDQKKAKVPKKFLKQPHPPIESPNERPTPAVKASYVIALALARECRPYDDGVFIKNLLQEILECFGQNGEDMALLVESIPVSAKTLKRRTEKISSFLLSAVQKRLEECFYFSISLDYSKDIFDRSQLIIYIKTVNENLVTHEDFLGLVPVHARSNPQALWEAIQAKVFSIGDIKLSKLSAICTDGTRLMVGTQSLIEYLNQHVDVPSFHCLVQQETLFAKVLYLNDVMKTCVKIINKIKESRFDLHFLKFESFLDDVTADFGDLLSFIDDKWLGRGRSLERFFELRAEILEYLQLEESSDCKILVSHLSDDNFVIRLAFLIDTCKRINEFNLVLQREDRLIFELCAIVNHFKRNLQLVNAKLTNRDISVLPKTASLNLRIPDSLIQEFITTNETILYEMNNKFADFYKISPIIDLHNNTHACNASAQSPEVQKEITEMQGDMTLSLANGKDFWEQTCRKRYPHSTAEIYKLYSIFGSTFTRNKAFSVLNIIKNRQRNTLTDTNLEDLMRIKLHKGEIDIDEVFKF